MSQAAPDDLDALLSALMAGSAPVAELVSVAESAPVVAALPPPELRPATAKVLDQFRAWLDAAEPGATWQPVELDPPMPEAEPLDTETLLELAVARAWQAEDLADFEEALGRLPVERANHHRRMASVCEMMRMRQEARARLKGEVCDRASPASLGWLPLN